MVNHSRKVFSLFKSTAEWFNDAVRASGLSGLCMTGYTTNNHGMQGAFVERWHKETSSFHLPVGEMTITLHGVQCLLHLPIRGRCWTTPRSRGSKPLNGWRSIWIWSPKLLTMNARQ